jgi:replication factor C subunit 1
MDSLEREEAEDFVKRHGGKVTSAVSGRTTFLVVGTSCGQSKVKKARELGTVLVDEDGLFALVEHLAKEAAGVSAEGGEDEEPEEGKGAARRNPREEEMPDAAAEAMKKPEPDGPAKPNEPKPEPKPDSSSHAAAVASGSGAGSSKRQQAEDSTPLWVNKYKPSAPAQLIGNGKNVADLRRFLQTWEAIHLTGEHPSAGLKGKDKPMKAVLISGPPGIGKSSAATIIARQLGF